MLPKTPVNERGEVQFPDPPFVQALFSSTKFAWLFLIIRLFLDYSWLTSGWGKLSNPAWMESGAAIPGFWPKPVARQSLMTGIARLFSFWSTPNRTPGLQN